MQLNSLESATSGASSHSSATDIISAKGMPINNNHRDTDMPATPDTPSQAGSSWKRNRRRSSFLSEAMLHEVHSSYETGRADDGSPRFSLNVRESQGFQWNPELFVSNSYRQISLDTNSVPQVKEIHIDEDEDIFDGEF